jgi:anaerobic selenocysteine-containing dehydrogenase
MNISRRRFLRLLSGAGVTISAHDWLFPRLEAYANERLAYGDLRGPGFTSFSRSVCRDCPNHCSLAMRKVDELPVGLRGTPWHPASLGALCVAGQSQMQALFDPDRLERPLQRPDAGAAAQAVEWDEGIQVLDERLRGLLSSGEGEKIAVVDGRTPSLGTRLLESWVRSIPGARYIPLRIEHALDRLVRQFLGGGAGGRLRFDLARAGTLLLVGSEILEHDGSPVTQMRTHGDRRENPLLSHAPTLYLGARQSPTAVQADYWIPCQPGREHEILLALAEALSKEHPQRDSILPEYARWISDALDPVGFARRYSLESVARRNRLDVEELEAAVRALRRFHPAVTLPGPGILRRPNGFSDAFAGLALNLWTDGFREEGGLSWGRDPLTDLTQELGLGPPGEADPASLSNILDPLFEIQRSPVDVLICVEANLVHELPGQDQIARALSHIPFVASFSTHEDETSRLSHVTVPTLIDLESWDLPSAAWGSPEASLQVQRPALVPVVEGRAVEDVVLGLASAGVAGPGFSPGAENWKDTVKAAVELIVERREGDLVDADGRRTLESASASAAVRSLVSGRSVWVAPSEPGARAEESEAGAEAVGGRGVRPERPPRLTDLAPNQLWLIPFDTPAVQRGRVLNRPMMMEISGMTHGLAWESWVEIHPVDARPRRIVTGDRVKIRGPRAEISTRAIVTRGVTPSVVAAPVGFGHEAFGSVAAGRGANPLKLPFAVLDKRTGAPAWGPVPVFLLKA